MSSDKLNKKKRNLPEFTESVKLLEDYIDEADPVTRLEYPYKIFESIKNETLDYDGESTDYTMPYAEISTLIYRVDFRNDDINVLVDQGQEYISEIDEKFELKQKSIARNVQKFCEHVQLASIQKNVLYKEQVKKIRRLEKEAESLGTNLNTAASKFRGIERRINKINMDAVGMIGLFSTIIFAVFGGLTYITSVGENLQNIRIYKLLTYASLSAILLLTVVFISYLAISRMTNLDLKSCCNKENCKHKFHQKYPYFCVVLAFFFLTFLVGGLFPFFWG